MMVIQMKYQGRKDDEDPDESKDNSRMIKDEKDKLFFSKAPRADKKNYTPKKDPNGLMLVPKDLGKLGTMKTKY